MENPACIGMNLLIDIGNTHTKVALADHKGVLTVIGVVEPTRATFASFFEQYAIQRGILTSTRGDAAEVAGLVREWLPDLLCFTPATKVPIEIDYLTPNTLGRDRVAAAVGATLRCPDRPLLIVDFGTALTIDYVSAEGHFCGGAISLGLSNRFRALEEYTAALPLCEATDSEQLIGRSTREAIEQGVMNSVQFELEGYIGRFLEKNPDLCVFFTGGEAKYFVKRIKNAIFAEPNLVFCGLNRILEYNATTKQ